MKSVISKIGIWIIIGVVGMVNTFGCSGSFQYAPYSSKVAGLDVSLEYVSGWKVQEARGGRGSYSHVIFIENRTDKEMKAFMTVTAFPLAEKDTKLFNLQSAADDLVGRRSQFKGFSVVSRSVGTLAGLATQEMELVYQGMNKLYRTDAKFVPIKERIVLCRKGGALYSFTYQSAEGTFDVFNKAFSRMLTTVVFKTE